MKNIHTQLNIQVTDDTVEIMIGDNKDLRDKVHDKNELLETKVSK